MAMTVRLPAELDARLEALAAERHTSKHALIIEATDGFLRQSGKTQRVLDAVDAIGEQYSDAVERLRDT